jgi:hypothetical protein
MRIVGGDQRDEIDGSTDTCVVRAGQLAGLRLVGSYAVGLSPSDGR